MATKNSKKTYGFLRTAPGKLFLAVVLLFFIFQTRIMVGAEPEAVYFVEGKEKMVALTFNIFWGEEGLEEILNLLNNKHADATFFVTGEWIREYPVQARRILQEGQEIGSHSFSLQRLTRLARKEIKEEFENFDKAADEVLHYKPKFFRPPYGEYNGLILKEARDRNFTTIIWTVNARNLMDAAGEKELIAAIERLQGGEIILFHGNLPNLLEMVTLFVESVNDKGLKSVKVSTLLK